MSGCKRVSPASNWNGTKLSWRPGCKPSGTLVRLPLDPVLLRQQRSLRLKLGPGELARLHSALDSTMRRVVKDNGIQFTNHANDRYAFHHILDLVCYKHRVELRRTKINHPRCTRQPLSDCCAITCRVVGRSETPSLPGTLSMYLQERARPRSFPGAPISLITLRI